MAEHQQPGEEQPSPFFSFRKKELAPGLQQKNWQAVETAIAGRTTPSPKRSIHSALVTFSLLAALIVGVIWFAQRAPPSALQELATHYGEIKRVTLPDGSMVVLNANSTIRIPQNWGNRDDRPV